MDMKIIEINDSDDENSATELKVDVKSEDVITDVNDAINNISVLENIEPKQSETVIKEEICSIENDKTTDVDLDVEEETLTSTDWSASIAKCIGNVSKNKMFIYTKRLDDMNIPITKREFSFKKIIASMEFESKPKFKRLTNKKLIHPTVDNVLDYSILQKKIRILNMKSRLYQFRAYRMMKRELDLCQPLSVTLFDYRKLPKLTNMSGIELHNEINMITMTLLNKARARNILKAITQVKPHLKDDVQGDTSGQKIMKTISLLDTKNCRIENYYISAVGNVISDEHLDLPRDTDWEVLKLSKSTYEVCCWYRREAVLKKLVNQTLIFQVQRLSRSHDCPIGECECCDKCKNQSKHTENLIIEISDDPISLVSPNLSQKSISTVFPSSSNLSVATSDIDCAVQKDLHTLGLKDLLNKPSILIQKDRGLPQQDLNTLKLSDLLNKPLRQPSEPPNIALPVNSNNLVERPLKFSESTQLVKTNPSNFSGSIAYKTNILLQKEKNVYMGNIIIVIIHSVLKDKKTFEEIYDIGNNGEIVLYHINEKINHNSICSDKFDSSKKLHLFNVCCWNNREKTVNELLSHKLSHETAKYIRRNHTCPIEKCLCCCKKIKKVINEITNTHSPESKTPDLALNKTTNKSKSKLQSKHNPIINDIVITEILKSSYISKTVTAIGNPFKSKKTQNYLSTQIFNNKNAIERNINIPEKSIVTDDDSRKEYTKWDIQLIINCLLKDMLYKLMKIELIINDEGKVSINKGICKPLSTLEDNFLTHLLVQMQNIVDWLRNSPDKNINDIDFTSTGTQINTLQSEDPTSKPFETITTDLTANESHRISNEVILKSVDKCLSQDNQSENPTSKSFVTITTDLTANVSPRFCNEGILKSVDKYLPQDNFMTSMKPKLKMSDSSKEIKVLPRSLNTFYYNTTPSISKTSPRNQNNTEINEKDGSSLAYLLNMDKSKSESQHIINNKVQLLTTSYKEKETLVTESAYSATSMDYFGATKPSNNDLASNNAHFFLVPPNSNINIPLTNGLNYNLHLPPPLDIIEKTPTLKTPSQNDSTQSVSYEYTSITDDIINNKIELYKRKFLEDIEGRILKKRKN